MTLDSYQYDLIWLTLLLYYLLVQLLRLLPQYVVPYTPAPVSCYVTLPSVIY